MKNVARTMVLMAALGMFACTSVLAQESPSGTADKQDIEALKQEVAAVKQEIKGMRDDMQKVLVELQRMKKSQAAQPTRANQGNRGGRKADTTVYDVNVGTSPIRGPKDAPVTITVFSDFQCPFSVRENPKIEEVLKKHPNDVRMMFKHFPLSFHPKAKPAHAATEFAGREAGPEAFWKMHDWIFENPKNLDVKTLRGYAEKLNLDLDKFDALMADEAKQNELIAADLAEARKCGVRGTPTVLINGLKLAQRNIPDYEARIDDILKKGGDKKDGDGGAKPAVQLKRMEKKEKDQ